MRPIKGDAGAGDDAAGLGLLILGRGGDGSGAGAGADEDGSHGDFWLRLSLLGDRWLSLRSSGGVADVASACARLRSRIFSRGDATAGVSERSADAGRSDVRSDGPSSALSGEGRRSDLGTMGRDAIFRAETEFSSSVTPTISLALTHATTQHPPFLTSSTLIVTSGSADLPLFMPAPSRNASACSGFRPSSGRPTRS